MRGILKMSCEDISIKRGIFLAIGILIFFMLGLDYTLASTWQNVTDVFGIFGDGTNRVNAHNTTFSVRSCEQADCSDRAWSSIYANATYNNISSLSNNRYFQYRSFFYTENQNYSSMLFNVTIGYQLLDIYKPEITLNSPENNTNSSSQNITFNFTATDTMASILECSLYINETLNATNSSVQNNTATIFNVSGMPDAAYLWNVTCSDGSNNFNSSENRILTIDSTQPFIQIHFPANTTYNSTSRTLNYTAIDLHLERIWYEYDNTNYTLTGNISFTSLNNQTSTITLYANDTLGNENYTSVTFTVDTVKPIILLNLPGDNSTTQQNLTLNFTVTDNIASSMMCSIYIDNVLNQTNSSTMNNTLKVFIIGTSPAMTQEGMGTGLQPIAF